MARATNLMIGTVTLTAIAVGLVGFLGFRKIHAVQQRGPLRIVFEGSATGLARGNSVNFDGVQVGEVLSIKLDGPRKIVALATVVETWGSAPRPVGSHLVIDAEGNFHGSVSGGCVEGAVVAEAVDVIGSGKARMLEFGVADETAWQVGLSCGGRIKVYVERLG